jgi:hypothetical protein
MQHFNKLKVDDLIHVKMFDSSINVKIFTKLFKYNCKLLSRMCFSML